MLFILALIGLGQLAWGRVILGGMESWGFNGVRSGQVSLLSPNKLQIKGLDYSGEGPALYFMIGKEDDPYNEEFAELKGQVIPDESGSCDRLQRYRNENVVLKLPRGMNFTSYDYLALYCTRFNHNFGYVLLKKDGVPPALDQMEPMDDQDLPKKCPQDHLEEEEEEDEEKKDEEKEEEEKEDEEDEDDDRRRRVKA